MSVMAYQITCVSIVYSTVCSGVDQRKYQSSASLVHVRGMHRWPMNSRSKGQWHGKCFHLMTSSWYCAPVPVHQRCRLRVNKNFIHEHSKQSRTKPRNIRSCQVMSYHFMHARYDAIWKHIIPYHITWYLGIFRSLALTSHSTNKDICKLMTIFDVALMGTQSTPAGAYTYMR